MLSRRGVKRVAVFNVRSLRPCVAACPLHNDIPSALWMIAQGDFIGAANVYRQTSIFPEFCGRVCPQERLCEGACAMGKHYDAPSLGKLEMFVADYQRQMFGGYPALDKKRSTGKSVAIVGSGPRIGGSREIDSTWSRRHRL